MGNAFYPTLEYITAITNANPALVTTSTDHDYTPGEIVSFRVTAPYGMVEINNQAGKVLEITSDTFTVNIDTTNYTPYVYPVSGENTPPVVVPSASGVVPGLYTPTMNLEDAFDNRPT